MPVSKGGRWRRVLPHQGQKWEPGRRGRCARWVGLGEADGIRGPAVPRL